MVSIIGVNDQVIPLQNHPLSLIRYACSLGADESDLLVNTELSSDEIDQAIYISYNQYAQLIKNTIKLLDKPGLGLYFGRELNMSAQGLIGFAAMSKPNIREALDLSVKYKKIISPITRFHYDVDSSSLTIYAGLAYGEKELEVFFLETLFSSLYHSFLYLNTKRFPALDACFKFSEPTYLDAYHEVFGENVSLYFDYPHFKMSTCIGFLAEDIPQCNPGISALAEQQCANSFEMFDQKEGVICAVKDLLLEIPGHFPSLDSVAEKLDVSGSTLKRRLHESKTSFQLVLDDVRQEISFDYLSRTSLTVDSIALKLQYKESSNFRRAFKKWTGMTPTEYRKESLSI